MYLTRTAIHILNPAESAMVPQHLYTIIILAGPTSDSQAGKVCAILLIKIIFIKYKCIIDKLHPDT